MEPAPDRPDVHLVDANFDPQLHASSAFFATWTGTIRVDAAGEASVLRRSGDEDVVATSPTHAAAIVDAFIAAGAPVDAGASGVWLPLAQLVPVLEHLAVADAVATCAGMQPPRVEAVDGSELLVRPGRIGDRAGWCAVAAAVTAQ